MKSETPVKISSPFDYPTRSDIAADQSVKACGCKCINIYAPSGLCPVTLNGTDLDSVTEWADKLMEIGHLQKLHFGPSALKYFVRHFYELDSPEHLAVCDCIQEISYSKIPTKAFVEEEVAEPIEPEPVKAVIEEPKQPKKSKPIKLAKINLDDVEEEIL